MGISGKINGLFAPLQRLFFKKLNFVNSSSCKNVDEPKNLARCYEKLSNFDEVEKKNILEELIDVQDKLERAHVIFNFQTNIDLIESSIYYIESLESKYNYLIKRARKMQLKCSLKPV